LLNQGFGDYETNWAAIDLFLDRATDSTLIKNGACTGMKLTDNAKKQLLHAKQFVEIASPRLIIVANAYASHLLRDELRGCSYNPLRSLSPKIGKGGAYRLTISERTNIPVFFSGMLTGRRSLDIFSRERLFWSVGQELRSAYLTSITPTKEQLLQTEKMERERAERAVASTQEWLKQHPEAAKTFAAASSKPKQPISWAG
jgi:hypothetical protein